MEIPPYADVISRRLTAFKIQCRLVCISIDDGFLDRLSITPHKINMQDLALELSNAIDDERADLSARIKAELLLIFLGWRGAARLAHKWTSSLMLPSMIDFETEMAVVNARFDEYAQAVEGPDFSRFFSDHPLLRQSRYMEFACLYAGEAARKYREDNDAAAAAAADEYRHYLYFNLTLKRFLESNKIIPPLHRSWPGSPFQSDTFRTDLVAVSALLLIIGVHYWTQYFEKLWHLSPAHYTAMFIVLPVMLGVLLLTTAKLRLYAIFLQRHQALAFPLKEKRELLIRIAQDRLLPMYDRGLARCLYLQPVLYVLHFITCLQIKAR